MIFPISAFRSPGGPAHDFSGLFATPIFWLGLSGALAMAIASGTFDGMWGGRGAKYFLAVTSILAMSVIAVICLLFAKWPEAPATARPLVPWSVYVLPPATLLGCFFALNPDLARTLNPLFWRLPLLISCGVSWTVGCGMLAELTVSRMRRQAHRMEANQQRNQDRDRQILAEVEAMQPERDFAGLLQHSNRWEPEAIQRLAVRKALALPDFTKRLAENLRTDLFGRGMYFVEAHETPDPQSIAEPFRDGVLALAADARRQMRDQSNLFADTFDTLAGQITTAADRFAPLGVDFVPAITEFRSAMDEVRADGMKPTCRDGLDRWLKAHRNK